MSLSFPDHLFRSFIGASIQSRLAIAATDSNWGATTPAYLSFYRFLRYMEVVPEATEFERRLLLVWFLTIHQNNDNTVAIAEAVNRVVHIIPTNDLTGDVLFDVCIAVDAFQKRDTNTPFEHILVGIHRTELAIALLYQTSENTGDQCPLPMHQAMFSPVHKLNVKYQADLYRMTEEEVDGFLRMANSGLPPGIVFLRPLTMRRVIYLANTFNQKILSGPATANGRFPIISLEGALAHAIRPTRLATNVIGGLTDIIGMQRSGAAGTRSMEHVGWKLIVQTCLETSAVIIVLPDCSEGMNWEITEIKRRGLFKKCMFIQLPERYDWHDQGNWLSYTKYFDMEQAQLNTDGQFIIGQPDDPDATRLDWQSLWSGELTIAISTFC